MSYENPRDRKYSQYHEWAKAEGNIVTLGITDHAQQSLGDIVFVELPGEGDNVIAGQAYGSVESVKAVSDIVASVNGKVVMVNEAVSDSPDLLNTDPYGMGWLIKVETEDSSDLADMISAETYEAFLAEEEH